MFFKTVLMIAAAALLSLAGCGLPGIRGLEPDSARDVLPRQHWETTDPQDGLFITYWEKNYTSGSAGMDLTYHGYDCSISNYTNNDIVCGKGIKPCYGETISWDTADYSGTNYFGVYGWLRDPLVEYYIGRGTDHGGAGDLVGTYTDSHGGKWDLYVYAKAGANIIHPTGSDNFLQFNCKPQSGGYPVLGSVTMADHYAGWEQLMQGWSKPGWDWHSIVTPDYCVVATEVWSSSSAHVSVSNINLTGVGMFANSTFSGSGDGDPGTAETGDNRGYYTDAAKTMVNFVNVYPELPIEFDFGDCYGNKIDLVILQTFAFKAWRADGSTYTRIIPSVPVFMGQADVLSGDRILVNRAQIDWYEVKRFEITKIDSDSFSFTYDFDGENAYSGYGVATRKAGSLLGASRSRAVRSAASPANLSAILSALKPKDLPINLIPKIGNGSASVTVNASRSAYSVESGEWNGVVQLQFTDPGSPQAEQIEVLVIDPVGNQKVYDFKAPDSNPYYWGWGGQMQFPKAHTRYTLVIRKVVPNPVSFALRAW
jgi:predicted small lipoprotein YifL